MISRTKRGVIASFLLALLLTVSSAVVYSAEVAEFSLSNVQVQKGRLFEITLSAKGAEDIAAFVAQLEYDADSVEYRSCSVCDEAYEYSINTNENGKLTVAFLCEDGVNTTEEKPLIKFTFKAIKSKNSDISLSVRDVIDSHSQDVAVPSCVGSRVLVKRSDTAENGPAKAENPNKNSTEIVDTNDDNTKGQMTLLGSPVNPAVIVSCGLALTAVLCGVVFFAYKLGVRKGRTKNTSSTPLEKTEEVRKNHTDKRKRRP